MADRKDDPTAQPDAPANANSVVSMTDVRDEDGKFVGVRITCDELNAPEGTDPVWTLELAADILVPALMCLRAAVARHAGFGRIGERQFVPKTVDVRSPDPRHPRFLYALN